MGAVAEKRGGLKVTVSDGRFSEEIDTGWQFEPVAIIGNVKSSGDVIRAVKKGLRVKSLDQLQSELNISSTLLRKTVKISPRTLLRRRAAGRLNSDESERVYRLGKLVHLATKVLGSDELASNWFKTPKKALGGATPLEYADTEIGKQEIEKLLYRTAYGVFS
jgi:putative toxin-antitoxin system antitoxin component (TIGR02293 family)